MQADCLTGVMAAKIEDVSGKLIGVLGAVNMVQYWKNPVLLENVTLSFSMFYNNMRSFKIIKEMGENDLLTGLLNRNSYQKRILEYPKKYTESIACIYADANGLHELNNSQGHEAGDRMLQCVARLCRIISARQIHIASAGMNLWLLIWTGRKSRYWIK